MSSRATLRMLDLVAAELGAAAGRPAEHAPRPPHGTPRSAVLQGVESLLEAAGMRLLGPRQRFEPLGDLGEAFVAGGLREARVHLRVLVGLAVDRRLQVAIGVADGRTGRRITDLLQEVEMPERMTG